MSDITLPAGINPFDVLGFNKTVLGGLDDTQVKRLIQANYRELSKIHHPDSGGNQKVFALITAADKMLEDDEARAAMLADHLASRGDKLDMANKTIERLKRQIDVEEDKRVEFIEAMAQAPYQETLNPFLPQPATLLCVDDHSFTLDFYFRKKAGIAPAAGLFIAEGMKEHGRLESVLLFHILPDGTLERQNLTIESEKPLTDKQYDALPVVRQDWLYAEKATKKLTVPNAWYTVYPTSPEASEIDMAARQRRGTLSLEATFEDSKTDSLYCFVAEEPIQLENWRIIGSFDGDTVHREMYESPLLEELGGSAKDSAQLTDELQNGYTKARFRHYLKDVQPTIEPNRYLVAAHRLEDEFRFAFLGRVEQILKK